jgi:His Kinase A (phospho-acceptor) domain
MQQVYRIFHAQTGEIRHLRSHAERTDNADGTQSLVGIMQDITELCRMQQHEAEQKLATEQLNALLAAEIKHKEEMYRLLRTISHEIRNPLHGILANTQALLDLVWHAEQQAAAEAAQVTAAAATVVSDTSSTSSKQCTCRCTCGASSISSGESPTAEASLSGNGESTAAGVSLSAAGESTTAGTTESRGSSAVAVSSDSSTNRGSSAGAELNTHVCSNSTGTATELPANMLRSQSDSAAIVAYADSSTTARDGGSADTSGSTELTAVLSSDSVKRNRSVSAAQAKDSHAAQRSNELTLRDNSCCCTGSAGSNSASDSSSSTCSDTVSRNSSSKGSSSSSALVACEWSGRLATVKGMVAEIHECGLHQVSHTHCSQTAVAHILCDRCNWRLDIVCSDEGSHLHTPVDASRQQQ